MGEEGFPVFFVRLLIHTGIQINHDIDRGDEDLGGDEDDDDPFEVFACCGKEKRTPKVSQTN